MKCRYCLAHPKCLILCTLLTSGLESATYPLRPLQERFFDSTFGDCLVFYLSNCVSNKTASFFIYLRHQSLIYLSSDDVVTFGLSDCASDDLDCAINWQRLDMCCTENQRFIWVHEKKSWGVPPSGPGALPGWKSEESLFTLGFVWGSLTIVVNQSWIEKSPTNDTEMWTLTLDWPNTDAVQ